MAPKKASSKPAPPTAADFNVGDVVLTKVKGYPEWPGKIVEPSSSPENIQRLKAGRPILVRFYPDADFVWAYPKELRQLTHKIIDAYLSDGSKKKQGKLRQGYEIAKDPSQWEAEQAKKDAAAEQESEEDGEEEHEDVDMLDEDADGKNAAGKKRKRTGAADKDSKAAKAKKESAPKAKKEPAAKKRKTDDKPKSTKAAKDAKEKAGSAALAPEEDGSEEEKTVKNWRALLQRAFLTKGFPEPDQMPKYDTIFKEMESFEMQPQWLATSKLGKVLKKMAALTEEIPRDAEFKIKERANALMEQWKGMLNKDPSSTAAPASGDASAPAEENTAPEDTNAGDLTVMQEDEKKEDPAVNADADADAVSAEPSTNGVDGGVNAEGQTNGEAKEDTPAETKTEKEEEPATQEEKKESEEGKHADATEVKENGEDKPAETTA